MGICATSNKWILIFNDCLFVTHFGAYTRGRGGGCTVRAKPPPKKLKKISVPKGIQPPEGDKSPTVLPLYTPVTTIFATYKIRFDM